MFLFIFSYVSFPVSKIPISFKITVTQYFLQVMTILLAALLIRTRTNVSCSSFKYSITAFRKQKKIFLLTEKESWRIFIFHSTNSFIVTYLGITEIICSMLESKRICVSLLHLFNFIDIDSFTLEPLPTSFLNLEFFIVLRSSVKK